MSWSRTPGKARCGKVGRTLPDQGPWSRRLGSREPEDPPPEGVGRELPNAAFESAHHNHFNTTISSQLLHRTIAAQPSQQKQLNTNISSPPSHHKHPNTTSNHLITTISSHHITQHNLSLSPLLSFFLSLSFALSFSLTFSFSPSLFLPPSFFRSLLSCSVSFVSLLLLSRRA